MPRNALTYLIVTAALVMAGCSSDETKPAPEPADTQPPDVTTVEPAGGTEDLPLLQPFSINFSEAMDPASLNPATVRIDPGDVPLQLSVAANRLSVTVQPDSMLPADESITITLAGPTDLAGNELPLTTIPAATGPLDCGHLADRFEPNETEAAATALLTDSTYYGLATCVNDMDCYSVTLEDTLKIIPETYTDYAVDEEWQIYWTRADGQTYATLGTMAATGLTASFPHTFLPGTYYLQISGYNEEDRILYDIRLRTDVPCPDDPYEDNDFMGEAAPIAAGLHENLLGCYLDEDWFSVPILAGQNLVLTTDTHDYQSTRRSRIVTPDGGHYQSTLSGLSTLTINWIADADGDARVMSMVWGDGVVYDMTIEVLD